MTISVMSLSAMSLSGMIFSGMILSAMSLSGMILSGRGGFPEKGSAAKARNDAGGGRADAAGTRILRYGAAADPHQHRDASSPRPQGTVTA